MNATEIYKSIIEHGGTPGLIGVFLLLFATIVFNALKIGKDHSYALASRIINFILLLLSIFIIIPLGRAYVKDKKESKIVIKQVNDSTSVRTKRGELLDTTSAVTETIWLIQSDRNFILSETTILSFISPGQVALVEKNPTKDKKGFLYDTTFNLPAEEIESFTFYGYGKSLIISFRQGLPDEDISLSKEFKLPPFFTYFRELQKRGYPAELNYKSIRISKLLGIIIVGGFILLLIVAIISSRFSDDDNASGVLAIIVILFIIAVGLYLIFR